MDKIILSRYNFCKQIEEFLLENKDNWLDYEAMQEEVAEFFVFLKQFETTKTLSENNTKGVTDNKKNTFLSMNSLSLQVAEKAFVWAKKTNNLVALNIFDVVESDFNTNQPKNVDLASNIHKTAYDNRAVLVKYRVTELMLTTLEDLIKKAKSEIGVSGAEKDKISTSLNELKPLMKSMINSIKNIEKLMGDFRESNPTLFNGFVTVNKMDDARTRYTKVFGKVTGVDGQPKAKFLVKIKELEDEQDITDLHGDFEMEEFKGGEYTLQVFDENGKLVLETPFKVLTGKKAEVNVVV